MNDNLRNLLPENLSDETAYHLVDFFYELAIRYESIYLDKIMRYEKAIIEKSIPPILKEEHQNKREELADPPF